MQAKPRGFTPPLAALSATVLNAAPRVLRDGVGSSVASAHGHRISSPRPPHCAAAPPRLPASPPRSQDQHDRMRSLAQSGLGGRGRSGTVESGVGETGAEFNEIYECSGTAGHTQTIRSPRGSGVSFGSRESFQVGPRSRAGWSRRLRPVAASCRLARSAAPAAKSWSRVSLVLVRGKSAALV